MDAHFANQIQQKTRTPNAAAFYGPERENGCGKLGAFAMRMGLVALPLVKQYVMAVAKQFGKNLSAFVPEISNVISRKRPKAVLGQTLKNDSKAIASTTSTAGSSERVNARAYTSNRPIAIVSEIVRPITAARDGAGRRRAGSGPSSGQRTRDNKAKEVNNRTKSAARNRSDILWSGIQQLLKNLIIKQQITKEGVMNMSTNNKNLIFGASSEIANPDTSALWILKDRPDL